MNGTNQDYKSNISIVEAINILKEHALALTSEELAITECYGKVLSEDLVSKVDHPSCDNSALDGYACKAEDTLEATQENPVRLKLIGDVPAGSVFEAEVVAGETVGIYTGAPLPTGADAIIAVEDTEKVDDETGQEKMSPLRPSDKASLHDINSRCACLRCN